MPFLMFGSLIFNEILLRAPDSSSAFFGLLMSSSKLFLFSNKALLISGVCHSHQTCNFLYYW